jgi:hypothetical protein
MEEDEEVKREWLGKACLKVLVGGPRSTPILFSRE